MTVIWNYKCACGYKWTCWWNKYSQDACEKCEKWVYPEEKIQ